MSKPLVPDGIDMHPEPERSTTVGSRPLLIIAVVLCIIAFFVVRNWRQRSAEKAAAEKQQSVKPMAAASAKEATKDIEAGLAPLKRQPAKPVPTINPVSQNINVPQLPKVAEPRREFPKVDPPPIQNPIQSFQPATADDRLLAAMRSANTNAFSQQQQPGVNASYTPQTVPQVVQNAAMQYPWKTASSNPKLAFLAEAQQHRGATENYLPSTRTPQLGLYEIKAGWEIPGVLEQQLNSEMPGDLKALVTQSVYDTATGRYLLIPQGARLIGKYNSSLDYGQSGVQVVWDRLIYPDGSSINLDGMVGHDSRGRAGMRDKVDRHMLRTVGFGMLTTAFVLPFELTQRRQYNNGYQQPGIGETASMAAGRELSNTGNLITRKNLNVQPTVKIPTGYRFTVRVSKDIYFSEPYSPYRNVPEVDKPVVRKASR